MNSSSPYNSSTWTSGQAMINYLSTGNSLFLLYSKSPMALDKFKFPLILPIN